MTLSDLEQSFSTFTTVTMIAWFPVCQ